MPRQGTASIRVGGCAPVGESRQGRCAESASPPWPTFHPPRAGCDSAVLAALDRATLERKLGAAGESRGTHPQARAGLELEDRLVLHDGVAGLEQTFALGPLSLTTPEGFDYDRIIDEVGASLATTIEVADCDWSSTDSTSSGLT